MGGVGGLGPGGAGVTSETVFGETEIRDVADAVCMVCYRPAAFVCLCGRAYCADLLPPAFPASSCDCGRDLPHAD